MRLAQLAITFKPSFEPDPGVSSGVRLLCYSLAFSLVTAAPLLLMPPAAIAEDISPVSLDSTSKARQIELENLLEQDCGSCHGLLLNGGLGPSLLPEALKGKSAEFLKITIRDGRPNTAMPPWEPLLSEADIDWLVKKLLQKTSVPLSKEPNNKLSNEPEEK